MRLQVSIEPDSSSPVVSRSANKQVIHHSDELFLKTRVAAMGLSHIYISLSSLPCKKKKYRNTIARLYKSNTASNMVPKEERSFYLYSTGYSPKLLTLGTLIYGNYGMPEIRRVTFPMRYEPINFRRR